MKFYFAHNKSTALVLQIFMKITGLKKRYMQISYRI